MTRLSLALLGPMQITLGGQPVGGFTYNKARALLAYLVVEAGRPHQRDALATLLWADMPDEAARHNLRQALANLRTALGDASATPPFLLITRDTIQFNLASDYDVDASTFTAVLAACVTHPHRRLERCRSCAARMEQALALYRGDFLAGFSVGDSAPFEEWQLRQRERLHQRALDALTRLADYHEWRGDDERARLYTQRQIELEPWREEAHRQLMRLLARGHQRSAALAQYEVCRRVLERDLGVEPEAETTALYERIRAGEQRIKDGHPHGQPRTELLGQTPLPIPPTLLIGRETELAELGALLENPAHRLITIVGPGGIGKTRLALAVAAEQAEAFTYGAAFVPLAAISSADYLAPAILAALDIALEGQRHPRDQLLDYLREKELLLLLDNFEQLLAPDQSENGGGTALLIDILQRAPGITLLLTSRERLALHGEWLFDLAGLSYPTGETVKSIEDYSAVRLFVQRAGQVRRRFALGEGEARAVARICEIVEGLPLAIELAAAAVRTRSCSAIANAIESSILGLASGLRAVPERHRSMWATFEHSWRLLSDEERQVFPRLSVFRGGFEEDAAAQVAQASPTLLTALLDKSLLRWDGAAHYDMHDLLRQFADEKLSEAREAEPVRDRHLDYFRTVAEHTKPELTGPNQVACLNRLELELDNLRAALGWAVEHNIEAGLRLAGALWDFWVRRGHVRDGCNWLAQLLMRPDGLRPTATRAKGLCVQSDLTTMLGEIGQGHMLAEESLALYRELGDQYGIASSLAILGWVTCLHDDYAVGRSLLMESLALYRELDDKLGIADVLGPLGFNTYYQNNLQARVHLEERLAIYRELGHLAGIGDTLSPLGLLTLWQGDLALARSLLEEGLEIHRKLENRGAMDVLANLGQVALHERNYAQARAYLEESWSLSQETGQNLTGLWALVRLGYVALRQGDEVRAQAIFDKSQRHFNEAGIRDGVVYALEGLASLAVAQGRWEPAVWLFAWADAVREVIGDPRPPVEQAEVDRDFILIRSQLDEAAIAAAQIEGRAMTMEQAIASALEGSAADSISSVATAAPQ